MVNLPDELQVEVTGEGKGLGFRFLEKKLSKRKIDVENIYDHQVQKGEKWFVNVVRDEKDGLTIVRLLRRYVIKKTGIVKTLGDDFWIDEKKLRHIQLLLLNGKDIILKGHRGTGKTEFALRLAEAANWTSLKVDCGLLQRPSDLFGAEAAQDGQTVWQPSKFSRFVEEAQKVHEKNKKEERKEWQFFLLILDEINRTHAKIAEGLHGLYDLTRQVSYTTSEGTKVLALPPNVMTIATMNYGRQYTGVFILDAALKDRFVVVPMVYPPEEFEIKWLISRHGIPQAQAKKLVAIANSLRVAEHDGRFNNSPSPRLTDAAAILVAHGETVADAVETVFLGDYEGEMVTQENGSTEKEESELGQARSHVRKLLELEIESLRKTG